MGTWIIFGAGPIGRGIADLAVADGHEVSLVSRRGSGSSRPGVRAIAADASDASRVADLVAGADVIVNALNPAYHRWATDWPPMADALLRGAESSGALLVTVSNLYGYGPTEGPLTEGLPLAATGTKGRIRAQMYDDALAAHTAGRIRTVELRASDYIGPGAESHMGDRVVPRILAHKSVKVVGAVDQPHTWTYTVDVARLAVAVATDPSSWGRAWHVPSSAPRTQQQVVADLAAAADMPVPSVSAYPSWLMSALGLVNPTIREIKETEYQFDRPFVMDSADAEAHFGMAPTPWAEVMAATVESYRRPVAA